MKAFDRIPYALIVREAIALGYPMHILRLSIATYRIKRVIRIRNVVSQTILALRGIIAGIGFATTEMRVILIRIMDKAISFHKMIKPTVFVDDIAADMAGLDEQVVRSLGGFIDIIARFFKKMGLGYLRRSRFAQPPPNILARGWQTDGQLTESSSVKGLRPSVLVWRLAVGETWMSLRRGCGRSLPERVGIEGLGRQEWIQR